jgi:hypothetical protein
MNAGQLVDLLLELNIINTQEIDQKLKQIAARIANPHARAWFLRVPRFYVINMEKQAETPYKLPSRFNKYPAFQEQPPGRKQPPLPGGPAATTLHKADVEQDIASTFDEFNPAKPPKKTRLGQPPSEVADWMKAAKDRGDKLYFFPPFANKSEVIPRLNRLADYLNYLPADSKVFNILRQQRIEDLDGFRTVFNDAMQWSGDIDDNPSKFIKRSGWRYGNLTMVTVTDVNDACELGKNTSWCTKGSNMAQSYLKNGPLFIVFKQGKPYVQVHRESGQAKDTHDREIDQQIAAEIAPLFKNISLRNVNFEHSHADSGLKTLQKAVKMLPPEVQPEKLDDLNAPPQKRELKRRLPPFDDEPSRDIGYRPSQWESLVSRSKHIILLHA